MLSSWLDERRANICINGQISDSIIMSNMIYQGTVLGLLLWNLFFADAQSIIQNAQSQSVVYADDINCYRKFINAVSNDDILSELRSLQSDLHTWGDRNFVSFDSAKESLHILSRHNLYGSSFKILGCQFDCKLIIHECIHDLITTIN